MFGRTRRGQERITLGDVGLLALRLTTGGLLAGHGAQKLFGAFGGHGLAGTAGWLASVGLRPGRVWSVMAGLSEFGGGVLMALGLFNPVGELGTVAAMAMATGKVHWGKPIWATSGGAELPVTNMAAASALVLAGPGRLSLDHALGTNLPRWVALPTLAAVGAGVAYGMLSSTTPERRPPAQAGAQMPMPDDARLA
jgi:putative oxidoreductase